MKLVIPLLLSLLTVGCVSGYEQFYKANEDPTTIPGVELLKEGEEPRIVEVPLDDLAEQVHALRAKGYVVVGYSEFNGSLEHPDGAKSQAKRVHATLVLLGSKYTNTEQHTSIRAIPTTSTTYSSGTVYGGGLYGGYSGSSTTSGTSYVPTTTTHYRYDQGAVFLVKFNKKFKYGLGLVDIPADRRSQLGRNMGAIVDLVLEATPAFYANVLEGDVLVQMDGVEIQNAQHALDLIANIPQSQRQSNIKVIRNGVERDIAIRFE